MSDSAKVLQGLQKRHGEHVGAVGVEKVIVPRIPTGIFQFDLATGGGIPYGRVSVVYGNEGSGKTTICHMLCRNVQAMGQRAVYLDLEHAYDAIWAAKLGVNTDEVILLRPDSAEMAVDFVKAMMGASDVGLIVIDSIAHMITTNEIESEASKVIVGGSSLITGKLLKLIVQSQAALDGGHIPTVVLINQIRHKIGVMFGDPETMPGGLMLNFAPSLTVRLYGKDEMVAEVSKDRPTFKKVTATIKKTRFGQLSKNFEYQLTLVPHGKLSYGESPSWNTVSNYLKSFGLLTKNAKGWECCGAQYKTLGELQEQYEQDLTTRLALQKQVTDIALENMDAPIE